ncbi:helix-turn-helix transcriptional regulator [Streptomyces sp. URMC 126]|uniref:helix-turn-helix transcriptional regulator n=1 Tax=Streptomyces sp. URMC 126 TaxID=3423401 RepID=UPI003F19B61C
MGNQGTAVVGADGAVIVAHRSLRRLLEGYGGRTTDTSLRWQYADDVGAAVRGREGVFAALPAFTPQHAAVLARVSAADPVAGIVGVVADAVGTQTHLAIQSGANWVLNLLVQPSESFRVLRGLLLQHAAAVGVPGAARPAPGAEAPVGALSEEDRALVRMLRERVPVGEMARRFYCSERSMYRRIRRVYEVLGVANRQELRTRLQYGVS